MNKMWYMIINFVNIRDEPEFEIFAVNFKLKTVTK